MRPIFQLLTLVYPFIILGFRKSPHFGVIALGTGSLLVLDLLLRQGRRALWLGGIGLPLILGLMQVLGLRHELRLYPFVMSFAMLLIFALSRDPNANPMLGPLKKKALEDPALLFALHEAKRIWIVGLALNSLVLGALLFVGSEEVWVNYAGFYSYLLLVGLFLLSVVYVHFRRRSLA